MRLGLSAVCCGVTGAISSTAMAQPAPPTAVPEDSDLRSQPPQPVFSLMDNTGEGSHALADVSFVSPDTSNPSDDPMVVRARVQAQYIGTAGFGGYATSALVFFKTTFTNND